VLSNQELTPNHLIKSQIEQWREEQKGVTARVKKLDALLAKIHVRVACGCAVGAVCSEPDVARQRILLLNRR